MKIWGRFFSWTCPCGDSYFFMCLGLFSVSTVLRLFLSVCFSVSIRLPLYVQGRGMGGGGGRVVRMALVNLPGSMQPAGVLLLTRQRLSDLAAGLFLDREGVCIWLVHLDFMSWLPFPALRFLPLGLHLRYREPHQPVQHQRNTSATCRTHLHPPEGAPVCGGWDQHQWSKYPRQCRHCTHRWPTRWGLRSDVSQRPRDASHHSAISVDLVSFCSSYFAPPPAESWTALRWKCISVFSCGIEAFFALLKWILWCFH